MKKSLFIFGLAALAAACSPQRPDRVDKPDVLASNAAGLDLTAVVASDTATVLSFDITFNPGQWISIAEGSYIIAGADTLPLLSAQGIVPGEQFTMPESGNHSFDLTFGPLAPSVKEITFSEGLGGWTLVGINLMHAVRTEPDVPAEILRESDGEVFAKPILEVADTEFRLHVIDYVPELGSKVKVRVIGLGGVSYEGNLTLDEKGCVTFTAPVYGTSNLDLNLIDFGVYTPAIVVAPGKTTDIYLDPRYTVAESAKRLGRPTPTRYVYDNGRYAALNTQLASTDIETSYGMSATPVAGLWKWSPEQFTDSVIADYTARVAEIDNTLEDTEFKAYVKARLTDLALTSMLTADYLYARSLYNQYPDLGDNWRDSVPALPGETDYIRAAKALDIANPELLAVPSYRFLVTEVNLADSGIDSPQVTDVATFFNACEQIDQTGELSEKTLAALRELSSPFYAQAAEARLEVVKAQREALSDLVNELPDVDDSKLFAAIVEQYKGKVVLVDLWNTWCGPCRRALAANEPLKTGELANPDIVWVYIADTSSNPATFAAMLPDIAGEHYMVNADQISAIRNQFNVDGIPYYILVDRQGNAVGHPDFRDHALLIEGVKEKL